LVGLNRSCPLAIGHGMDLLRGEAHILGAWHIDGYFTRAGVWAGTAFASYVTGAQGQTQVIETPQASAESIKIVAKIARIVSILSSGGLPIELLLAARECEFLRWIRGKPGFRERLDRAPLLTGPR
jgi:hypothetical protein